MLLGLGLQIDCVAYVYIMFVTQGRVTQPNILGSLQNSFWLKWNYHFEKDKLSRRIR